MACRTLAVRAANMNTFELFLRITKSITECPNVGEVFLQCRCSLSAKHGELCKKKINRF